MSFRKGAVADVLWFMAIAVVFIIIARTQLEFSNTATIDTYVKNIVNAEATRFVSSISGYSTNTSTLNMYNSAGVKRNVGSESDLASALNSDSASANGIKNRAKKIMIDNIKAAFANNINLKTKTKGVADSDVVVEMVDRTGKSTIVTVTLNYTVVSSSYQGKTGGFVQNSGMEIPRKVIVTRVIENPLRFK